jgi:hypothetical protein
VIRTASPALATRTLESTSAAGGTGAPAQAPLVQVSEDVQTLPSLHAVPSGAHGSVHAPVAGLHVPGARHVPLAMHATGLPPTQVPFWQVSARVQALPSLQAIPFGAAGVEHAPVAGSHVPATWHASLGAHATGLPPTHAPLWQLSVEVHALPSLHGVPFGAAGFEHTPVAGSHVPIAWHASLAAHTTRFSPTHAPPRQLSARVQAFPSLHAVPSGATGFEQRPVAGSHVPATWQASEAVHTVPAQGWLRLPEISNVRTAPEPSVSPPWGTLTMATMRNAPDGLSAVPRQ